MKINTVKEGYYIIWDVENDVKLDQKSSEVEAIQGLINYQLEGKDVTMIPPTYRVDIEDADGVIVPEDEIIYAEGYVHMTSYDGTQYLRVFEDREIIRLVSGQKARKGQGKFILKRTQSVDLIDQYELYGEQPFEIENDHEILDYETGRVRLWATEPWGVEYFVNGIREDRASDPVDLAPADYDSGVQEDGLHRHTRYLAATYGDKIKAIAYNGSGESDEIEFTIETEFQLDQSARIKALNEEITLIMQEKPPVA